MLGAIEFRMESFLIIITTLAKSAFFCFSSANYYQKHHDIHTLHYLRIGYLQAWNPPLFIYCTWAMALLIRGRLIGLFFGCFVHTALCSVFA